MPYFRLKNTITNRFSADIWWNDFRIDFSSTSESNSFPFQAFEFSSTWGLSWDQISFFLSEKYHFERIILKINFKILISKFQILESKKKNKKCIERFLIHSQERLWYRICGMIQPCHCSFPRNTSTWGVRLALRHCESLLVRLSTFLGLVFPSSRFKRSFSVWFVFSFKNSFFFEANYRFDKHFGFHVCLAKTFSINLCWRTQVFQKVSCPRGDHNPSTSAF